MAGANSDTSSELFAWYKVDLPGNHDRMVAKLEQVSGRLDPSNPALAVLQQLIDAYKSDPSVQAAVLDNVAQAMAIPNDPYYSSSGSWGQTYDDMWGLKKINAAAAWDQTTGSPNIVVASIDTGVDRNHPDLAANMWVNSKEIPGNGKDDDGNGYVDDYYGWNFVNNTGDPLDDHGHGTHTSGTIGAVGNNGIGVVGVNWTVKIMAVKILDSTGYCSFATAAKGMQYAADMGANVSNNSWGGNGADGSGQIIDDAVKYEHDKGMTVVAAAGNNNSDVMGVYSQTLYIVPAASEYAITVSATDHNDLRSDFSNFGQKIDVAAPGGESGGTGCPSATNLQTILSLRAANTDMYGTCAALAGMMVVGNQYYRARGTSMSSPHVAGLAALLLAKNPTLSNEEIRQIIRNGADDTGTVGWDPYMGYGRINAGKSMALTSSHILAPVISSPSSNNIILTGTQLPIYGSMPGPNFANYTLSYGSGDAPTSWNVINSSTTQLPTSGLLGTFDFSKLNDGPNIVRLSATDTGGKNYLFQVYRITVDNFDSIISSPTNNSTPVLAGTKVDIIGTAQSKNGVSFDHYVLESSLDRINWSTTGFTLVNNGLQPIVTSKLGTLDTTNLQSPYNRYIRLRVMSPDGRYDQTNGTSSFVNISSTTPTPSSILTPTTTPLATPTGVSLTPSPTPSDASVAPTVSIASPTTGSTVPVRNQILIIAAASDNVGVTKVEFYINGALTCTDSTSAYTCSWKVPAKKGIQYSFVAKAYDAAGNVTSSAPVLVTSQ